MVSGYIGQPGGRYRAYSPYRTLYGGRRRARGLGLRRLCLSLIHIYIRNMTSVVGMSYLIYDEDEELFADIVDTYAEMQYKCVEAVLETGAKFDYAHFWEDICFKNGPLLSPVLFQELCAKQDVYKRQISGVYLYHLQLSPCRSGESRYRAFADRGEYGRVDYRA